MSIRADASASIFPETVINRNGSIGYGRNVEIIGPEDRLEAQGLKILERLSHAFCKGGDILDGKE